MHCIENQKSTRNIEIKLTYEAVRRNKCVLQESEGIP